MQVQIFLTAVLALLGSVEPVVMACDNSNLVVAVTAVGEEMTSPISPRFGHSNFCTIVETHPVFKASALKLDPIHTGVDLVNELLSFKVNVVITGKIGPNALRLLRSAEVRVVQDVSGTVKEALEKFEAGEFD